MADFSSPLEALITGVNLDEVLDSELFENPHDDAQVRFELGGIVGDTEGGEVQIPPEETVKVRRIALLSKRFTQTCNSGHRGVRPAPRWHPGSIAHAGVGSIRLPDMLSLQQCRDASLYNLLGQPSMLLSLHGFDPCDASFSFH